MLPLAIKHGIGPVWDALAGRIGVDRAARVFRQALGANLDAAKQALAKGSKDTASRVLSAAGIDAGQFFATGDIVAKAGHSKGVLDDIAAGRKAAQKQVLNAAAGGETRAASRQAAAAQRRGTSQQAIPQMTNALAGANATTREAVAARNAAAAGRSTAATETATAKRLLGAGDEQAMRLGQMDDLGDTLDMGAINRQRGIVGGLEQRGEEAANRGLEAGAQARTAEQRLQELKANGVEPLDAAKLSGKFRGLAAAQSANPERAAALTHFANEVDRLAAENGGIIDAHDLSEIRKDAGNIVEGLLMRGGAGPQAVRKQTARVIGEVRPVIDEAITAAGGKGWGKYLDTFSAGMEEAKRVEFSDFARKLANDQPDQFVKLMQNDRPDIIDKFFGKGRFDTVEDALGPTAVDLVGPAQHMGQILKGQPAGASRLPALQGVAQDFSIDKAIKNAMTPGATSRANVALEPPANALVEGLRSLPLGTGKPFAAAADLFSKNVTQPKVIQALEQGFASPQGAVNLLNYTPTGTAAINVLEGLPSDVLRTMQMLGVQVGRNQPNPNAGY
jgi:hypothetical protein